MADPVLTIHHLRLSQSERVIWLCEELGLPYTLKAYDRDPETSAAPASYKALHPTGTAPVITDGDIVLGETNAIVEYILAKANQRGGDDNNVNDLALPPNHPNYAPYLFWLHHANGSLQPALNGLLFSHMQRQIDSGAASSTTVTNPNADIPSVSTINQARLNLALSAMETQLSQSSYLAGAQFTAADCMALFPLTTFRLFLP
ncbi:glutathione S-transferase family protein [Aspergillus mulundensis]|uniref:glutathione transferase n=1 Tax=Aspergillus mulundensis TaxID=1810919 RepID=A0A3D8REL6_9EURO|nr:hypothetical protein DSM5745_07540 [Aspergillus mulundensis]RDW72368.1 hypothetical protein DSM5745_07540 [Aspergillus mulundensis]